MKKEYLSPIAEMLDVTVENHILDDSHGHGGTVTPGEGPEAGGGFGANKNRGQWGDVWK